MTRPAPPEARSRKGTAFSAAAAAGRLSLQRCSACASVCYPAREACPKCWSPELEWSDMPGEGTLLAETTVRASFSLYFQQRGPWRIGTVQLDTGPVVLAHLHRDVREQGRVRVVARTDQSGQGVLAALPREETANMMDDPALRSLTCDPRGRAVLVTDGCSAVGLALAKALSLAGASPIRVGVCGGDAARAARAELEAVPGVELIALDPSDAESVAATAAAVGDALEILVNTTGIDPAGHLLGSTDIAPAQREIEVNYLSLLRLTRAFAPALARRGPHADGRLGAFVNLLPANALCNAPPFGTASASQAAAYSLAQGLRIELAGSGVKVIQVLHGPLDDAAHSALPPPKVTAVQLAAAVVGALQQGIEDLAVGPVAEDIVQRFGDNPLALQRERMQHEFR